jgi:hypothetical protein
VTLLLRTDCLMSDRQPKPTVLGPMPAVLACGAAAVTLPPLWGRERTVPGETGLFSPDAGNHPEPDVAGVLLVARQLLA